MAKSAALSRFRKMQVRAKSLAASRRAAARQAVKEQQGLLISGGSAFGVGFAEKQGFRLPTIDKIDPVALYAGLSMVGAFMIRDKQIRDIFKSTTVGLASIALYKAGRLGFDSLFNYSPPVAAPATAGSWGEEIVETGEF